MKIPVSTEVVQEERTQKRSDRKEETQKDVAAQKAMESSTPTLEVQREEIPLFNRVS